MAAGLAGSQFFLVLGSIWNTCALVVKMGCSLKKQRKKKIDKKKSLMCLNLLYKCWPMNECMNESLKAHQHKKVIKRHKILSKIPSTMTKHNYFG